MRLGIFDLQDAPSEAHIDAVAAAFYACDFPWERIEPYIAQRKRDFIPVVWWDLQGGIEGQAYPVQISLSDDLPPDETLGRVFLHEYGHIVDFATCDDADHDNLEHGPLHFKVAGDEAHFALHDWWSEPYWSRLGECFAETFVGAFAPTYRHLMRSGWYEHTPHLHDDSTLAEFRRLVLAHDVIADPIPVPIYTPPQEEAVRTVMVTVQVNGDGDGQLITEHAWPDFRGLWVNSGYDDNSKIGHTRPIPRVAPQNKDNWVRVEVQGGWPGGKVDVFLLLKA